MAAPKQEFLQDIPLHGGVDLRTHEFNVQSPSMLLSRDTQFEVQGTVKKRPARGDNTDVGSSGDSVVSMAKRGREAIMLTSDGPYALDDIDGAAEPLRLPGTTSDHFRNHKYMAAEVESFTAYASADSQSTLSNADGVCVKNGNRIMVLRTDGGDYVGQLFDADSGRLIHRSVISAMGSAQPNSARVVPMNAEDFRAFFVHGTNEISTCAFDTSAKSWGGRTSLWSATTSASTIGVAYDENDVSYLVSRGAFGTNEVRLSRIEDGAVDTTTTYTAGAAVVNFAACKVGPNSFCGVYVESGATSVVEIIPFTWTDPTISTTFVGRQVFSGAPGTNSWKSTAIAPITTPGRSGTNVAVLAEFSGQSVPGVDSAIIDVAASSAPSSTSEHMAMVIRGRGVTIDGAPYFALMRRHAPGTYGNAVPDPGAYIVSLYETSATSHQLSVVARIGADWVCQEDDAARVDGAMTVDPDDASAFYMALTGEPTIQSLYESADPTSLRVYRVDLKPKPVPFTESEYTTQLFTGLPGHYDGEVLAENGPNWRPDIGSTGVTSGAGSGAILTRSGNGVYSFRAVYTWRDASGQLHRSAPGNIATVTVDGTTEKAIVYVEKLTLTGWEDPAHLDYSVELYATEEDGTKFYLLDDVSNPSQPLAPSGSGSGAELGYWAYDNVIPQPDPSNPVLYTDGGEIEPDPLPATIGGVIIKDRAFAIAAEDRELVWASKPKQTGIAWEWSAGQVYRFPGGENTAISEESDLPIVFKRDSIWTMYGEGPNSNGNGAFALPTRVASVGCINRATLVRTPAGLIFQSERGFYMLTGMQVRPIGVQVDDVVTSEYTGAMLNEAAGEVIFTCPSSVGHWLVYNYILDKWSEWTGEDAACALSRETLSDRGGSAIDHGLLWCSTAATPQLYELSDAAGSDSIVLETPWFKPGGIQGNALFHELFFEAEWLAAHSVRIRIFSNFSDTDSQDREWPEAQVTDAVEGGRYTLAMRFNRQKVKCIKVRIEEQGAIAEAMRPTGLAIKGSLEKGPYRRLPVGSDASAETAS